MDKDYDLSLHNIFFSEDYRREFEQIFREQALPDDPTIYVHVSTAFVPQDAPEGHSTWFILVNAPADTGQDWEALRPKLRHTVITKLERMLGQAVGKHIVAEDYLDPPRIQLRTGSHQGALYGSSSNSKTAAFFRQPNFSRNIRNLYFVGGSVHPGGGIPLCLSSAEIVSKLAPSVH